MSKKIRVGLIYGGKSFEHEVSKMTAKSILENIDRTLFDVEEIYIDKNGRFDEEKLVNIDVAFLAVHGPNCEDGKLQAYLEKRGIKYTGSDVKASKINMDKIKMHKAFRKECLPVVKYLGFTKTDNYAEMTSKIEKEIGFPCFIKPNNAGSSIGISQAKNIHDLQQGIPKAFDCDKKIIVEQAINKRRDVELGVLGNIKLIISDPVVVKYEEEFYDYKAKYFSKSTSIAFDSLDISIKNKIKKIGSQAFLKTGCKGYARIDFFLNDKDSIFINEINTLPGFTSTSVYPKLMQKTGINYQDLITKIIRLTL